MAVHDTGEARRPPPPRLAEAIADSLRERILANEFADGDSLPKQEELVRQYGVSLPSVREALRVLETEGLVTIQRGKIGGSIVHVPRAGKVAYMLGMVLQSREVEVDDVVHAISQIEPLCARECARRSDRRRTVIPVLRRIHNASEAAIGNPSEFARLAREFHEQIVATGGNETFIVMVGALVSLWTAQVQSVGDRLRLGEFEIRGTRERSFAEHARLLECIVAGDADAAERVAREHDATPARHGLLGRGMRVAAAPLRDL
jgi:DNA-binding FadR family transcriptional regulator